MNDNRDSRREPPSPARIGIWVIVGIIGAYMLISGVIGIIGGGGG